MWTKMRARKPEQDKPRRRDGSVGPLKIVKKPLGVYVMEKALLSGRTVTIPRLGVEIGPATAVQAVEIAHEHDRAFGHIDWSG